MAQNRMLVASGLDGESFREQINSAHVALSTMFYGPVDPATEPADEMEVSPGMLWWDTSATPFRLKVRTNTDIWVTLLRLNAGVVQFGPDLQAEVDTKLSLSGGTMTGDLVLAGNPNAPLKAATKQYVDSVSRPAPVRWNIQGTAQVTSKVAQVLIDQNCQATSVLMYSDTAPTGAALTISIVQLRAGATIATVTASIGAGANQSETTISLNLLKGDRLRLNITGVGTGTPGGNDLMVTIVLAA